MLTALPQPRWHEALLLLTVGQRPETECFVWQMDCFINLHFFFFKNRKNLHINLDFWEFAAGPLATTLCFH